MRNVSSRSIGKMDVKQNDARSVNGKKAMAFFGEVKQELKRVDWTTKEELKVYTKIVLASTFLFALFIYGVDLLMQSSLGLLKFFVGLFAG